MSGIGRSGNIGSRRPLSPIGEERKKIPVRHRSNAVDSQVSAGLLPGMDIEEHKYGGSSASSSPRSSEASYETDPDAPRTSESKVAMLEASASSAGDVIEMKVEEKFVAMLGDDEENKPLFSGRSRDSKVNDLLKTLDSMIKLGRMPIPETFDLKEIYRKNFLGSILVDEPNRKDRTRYQEAVTSLKGVLPQLDELKSSGHISQEEHGGFSNIVKYNIAYLETGEATHSGYTQKMKDDAKRYQYALENAQSNRGALGEERYNKLVDVMKKQYGIS